MKKDLNLYQKMILLNQVSNQVNKQWKVAIILTNIKSLYNSKPEIILFKIKIKSNQNFNVHKLLIFLMKKYCIMVKIYKKL